MEAGGIGESPAVIEVMKKKLIEDLGAETRVFIEDRSGGCGSSFLVVVVT